MSEGMKTKGRARPGVAAVRLAGESVRLAFSSLLSDRFRSFLSLSGVSVGIFTVVAVFSLVESLRLGLSKTLDSVGDRMVLVQEFPWEEEDGAQAFRWREYLKRPPVSESEARFLRRHLTTAAGTAYVAMFDRTLQSGRRTCRDVSVVTASEDWPKLFRYRLSAGRFLSVGECRSGAAAAVIGAAVARELFGGADPVGRKIRIAGHSAVVAGVFEAQGKSRASLLDMDRAVAVPLHFARNLARIGTAGYIALYPKEGVPEEAFLGDIRQQMRSVRRIPPQEADNFSLNRMTFLEDAMDDLFRQISLAGWVIGGFSLLIGGFGIANILFVSVKERTPQIGIQKALGARQSVILLQYLSEAAVLSLLGGLLGILLASVLCLLFGGDGAFPVRVSAGPAFRGLAVALTVGVVSGVLPARLAARLDPVRAISSN